MRIVLLNPLALDSDTSFSEKHYEHPRRENVFIGRSPVTALLWLFYYGLSAAMSQYVCARM
jgi:hypothetical protein